MFLHPHFIKFEKPKNELYLTFSAVVKDNEKNKILKIQKNVAKIIKKEKTLGDLEIEEKRDGLYKRIERGDRFVYKYPLDRLHFSMVNFATYDIRKNIVSLQDFDKAREFIENTANFRGLKKKIKNFKKLFLKSLEGKSIKVEIRRVYLSGGIEGSLALNAFPIKEKFFENLDRITENKIKEIDSEDLPLPHNIEIKAHPKKNYKYFALNIFRFIDRNDNHFNQGGSFYKKIEKINKDFKRFTIKMKPRIVVSDPYLANNEPTKIDC